MNAVTPAVNVAARLKQTAARNPDGIGIVQPGRRQNGKRQYRQVTFAELDEHSDRIAGGIAEMGVPFGARLILLVPPSIEFITLFFALLKAGVVTVLIDPGMGRRNLLRCLSESRPEGFVTIPMAQVIRRLLFRKRFPQARFYVTVGRRGWGGVTYEQLQAAAPASPPIAATSGDDAAAIIFTTGSTGPPKGVLYRHQNFDQQALEIQKFYGIEPGELDLPAFPLFALFNCAMGVTTVLPDMDPTRPARVNPENILEAARDWQVTQAFGSPALWNAVGRHCERTGQRIPSLKRVLSAGAPVPPHVLERMRAAIADDGEVHTPYGATEALPVASIDATTVLEETRALTDAGRGVCVGHHFPGIAWRVIRIRDDAIPSVDECDPVPQGEIGELMVQGPVVTSEYVTRESANALHKVRDGNGFWHRMGDVGYLDEQNRFWFCGRKAHRVRTAAETLYTIPCEAILNCHPAVYRSALVGVGAAGEQLPVAIIEPWPEHWPRTAAAKRRLVAEVQQRAAASPLTSSIQRLMLRRRLPTDIRHNAKIFREQLAVWAADRLA